MLGAPSLQSKTQRSVQSENEKKNLKVLREMNRCRYRSEVKPALKSKMLEPGLIELKPKEKPRTIELKS